MHTIALSIYILVFIALCLLLSDQPSLLCASIIVSWFIIFYTFYRIGWQHDMERMSSYTIDESYRMFCDGDIVFTREYDISFRPVNIYTYHYNYGIAHTGMINKQPTGLYILHSTASETECDQYIIHRYMYLNMEWKVVNEPLLEYLIRYASIFHIVRHPTIPISIKVSELVFPPTLTMCSNVIATILEQHGVIRSHQRWIEYEPDRLITHLDNAGYKNLYFYNKSSPTNWTTHSNHPIMFRQTYKNYIRYALGEIPTPIKAPHVTITHNELADYIHKRCVESKQGITTHIDKRIFKRIMDVKTILSYLYYALDNIEDASYEPVKHKNNKNKKKTNKLKTIKQPHKKIATGIAMTLCIAIGAIVAHYYSFLYGIITSAILLIMFIKMLA
jgi:hypothetical protein